jgi:hypothetical protein
LLAIAQITPFIGVPQAAHRLSNIGQIIKADFTGTKLRVTNNAAS